MKRNSLLDLEIVISGSFQGFLPKTDGLLANLMLVLPYIHLSED